MRKMREHRYEPTAGPDEGGVAFEEIKRQRNMFHD